MTKRINPATGQIFKRGEVREDGRLFYKYTARLKADGTYVEIWLTPDALENVRKADSKLRMSKYDRISDRLPRGTLSLLENNAAREVCRKAYREMRRKDVTQDQLRVALKAHPKLIPILLPYTSDFEDKA